MSKYTYVIHFGNGEDYHGNEYDDEIFDTYVC